MQRRGCGPTELHISVCVLFLIGGSIFDNSHAALFSQILLGGFNLTGAYYFPIGIGNGTYASAVLSMTTNSLSLAAEGCTLYTLSHRPTLEPCPHKVFFRYSEGKPSEQAIPCGKQCRACSRDSRGIDVCMHSESFDDGEFAAGQWLTDTGLQLDIAAINSSRFYFNALTAESLNYSTSKCHGGDGMFGLLPSVVPPSSSAPFGSIVDQIIGVIKTYNVFTLCLGNIGGMITFGGPDLSHAKGHAWPDFTPLASTEYYAVKMLDIRVARPDPLTNLPLENAAAMRLNLTAVSIGVSASVYSTNDVGISGTLVDVGEPLIGLPYAAISALRDTFARFYCHLPGICNQNHSLFDGYCLSLEDYVINLYPPIYFVFPAAPPSPPTSTITIKLLPKDYLYGIRRNRRTLYCLGIRALPARTASSPTKRPPSVLGQLFLKGFVVVFDRAGGYIGFSASAGCSTADISVVSLSPKSRLVVPLGGVASEPLVVQAHYVVRSKHNGTEFLLPMAGAAVELRTVIGAVNYSAESVNESQIIVTGLDGTARAIVKPILPGLNQIEANVYGSSGPPAVFVLDVKMPPKDSVTALTITIATIGAVVGAALISVMSWMHWKQQCRTKVYEKTS